MIAKVLIDNLSVAGDSIYDYQIPEKLIKDIEIGKRVLVFFGRGRNPIPALVIEITDKSDYDEDKLKEIYSVLDDEVVVRDYQIKMIKFMRDEYFCTYIDALRCVLPSLEQGSKKEFFDIIKDYDVKNPDNHILEILSLIEKREGKASFDYLKTKFRGELGTEALKEKLNNLVRNDYIKRDVYYAPREEEKEEILSISGEYETLEDCLKGIRKNAKKQIAVIETLFDNKCEYSVLRKETGIDRKTLNKLIDARLVKQEFRLKKDSEYVSRNAKDTLPLNEEQENVLKQYEKCSAKGRNKFLLFGVTGSGKTKVYINMFKDIIKQGKQCLFLVPEIALTPQMMRNIYDEFDGQVAIMHSKLSQSKRISEWDKVRRGEAKVILGARSAIFMPFKDLGIIVIDEEHENTYKSSSTPRYNTIELANYMADMLEANLVLGSATPSVDSYYHAMQEDYKLLEIKKRANKKDFPSVQMVDMAGELRTGNRSPISRSLQKQIADRLKKNEQVILFINRRGFSTYVFCRECSYTEKCPNCDVSLTYHQGSEEIVCHYCGYSKKIPTICPECGSDKIKYLGTGTQKIEAHVRKLFPSANILRMDFDTTRRKGSMESILSDFGKGKADILIGTQMVVKGHDFANVTLVGILLADSALNFPDISAGERTFQLSTQAAGRAGRGEVDGLVVMQTYTPRNKTLVYSSLHDYKGFYSYEIQYREKMKYPPFTEIMGIFVANEDEEISDKECEKIYEKIKKITEEYGMDKDDIKLYRPMDAFIHKLKNKYIKHVLIRYNKDSEIKKVIRDEYSKIRRGTRSTVFVEINPVTLL